VTSSDRTSSPATATRRSAGTHQVTWRGRDERGRPVASGTYFYMLEAGDFSQTGRMILVK